MGTHSKSNKEVRKRKYAEQFAKTAENKKRKAKKRAKQNHLCHYIVFIIRGVKC